jgi:hypothetical protein
MRRDHRWLTIPAAVALTASLLLPSHGCNDAVGVRATTDDPILAGGAILGAVIGVAAIVRSRVEKTAAVMALVVGIATAVWASVVAIWFHVLVGLAVEIAGLCGLAAGGTVWLVELQDVAPNTAVRTRPSLWVVAAALAAFASYGAVAVLVPTVLPPEPPGEPWHGLDHFFDGMCSEGRCK